MTQQPFILSDWLRGQTKKTMAQLGMALHRLGIHPDTITILGLVVVALAAVVIAQGQFQLGAVILIVGLPLDALDGAVARAMERKGKFGGVLDSTLDRYADAFIFGGLSYYFAVHDQFGTMLLALAALAGAFGVSYVRARAGEAGLSVKIGLFDRLVRVVITLVILLIPALLTPGLWVLALGNNFTSLQRLWYVYRNIQ